MSKKITLISQGCRLNHSETASLINAFKNGGATEVNLNEHPDIVVINTCTVTENGDKDTIKLIKKINQSSNQAKIALIGCQAQIKKSKLFNLRNVKWVIGNEQKKDTANIVLNKKEGDYLTKISNTPFTQDFSSFDPRHTRVNLKIQDGCDFYCSFCIIPFARGPARSRDFKNIIDDARGLINMGVKELVLTGINCGTYQNNGKSFNDLLETLLNLNEECRVRISSIEPTTIDKSIIKLWEKYPNFCRYLHLPIQSGTNEILKKMRRKYTIKEYNDFVEMVAKEVPDACIGTDVIVGFPGESDDLFQQTKKYLEESPINYFHVFSYSERSMAHSRKYDHPIKKEIIKKRSLELRDLHKMKWKAFLNQNIGKTTKVLFEQKKDNHWVGSTEHFIKINVKSSQNLKNKMIETKLEKIKDINMLGKIK